MSSHVRIFGKVERRVDQKAVSTQCQNNEWKWEEWNPRIVWLPSTPGLGISVKCSRLNLP